MTKQHTYYGNPSGRSATHIVSDARRDAIRAHGNDGRWDLEYLDLWNREIRDSNDNLIMEQSKVVVRQVS